MAVSFTIVVHVRHQFGDTDQNIGVFAGLEQSFPFDCPSVSSDHALLLFQSLGVGEEQTLEVNGVPVFGGVPATDVVRGGTGGPIPPFDVPSHGHQLLAGSLGWAGNVLIINQGVLKDSGNILRIASGGDEFVVDNVVVVYKTRATGPVVVGETS